MSLEEEQQELEKYAVVLFTDERNAPGIVLMKWVFDNGKQCLYPNVKTNEARDKLLKQKCGVQDCWTSCQIKILNVYETFNDARARLRKAEDTSNLSSDDEEIINRPRRRILRKLVLPGEDSNDEESVNCTPPSSKTIHKSNLPSYPSAVTKETSVVPLIQKTPAVLVNHKTSAGPIMQRTCSSSSRLDSSTAHFPVVSNTVSSCAGCAKQNTINIEIREVIQNMCAILQRLETKVDALHGNTLMPNAEEGIDKDEHLIIANLPVDSREKFQILEDKLKENGAFQKKFCRRLATVGGKSSRGLLHNMLRTVLLDSVATSYSLSGKELKNQKKILPFIVTETYKNLTFICKKVYDETDTNIKVAVSDWLNQAKFRANRRQKLSDCYNGSLLPVYVYIYGGYFINGHPAEYHFQGFLDENIVAVSMNFRSGLGFLATGDNVIPGNLGIKDQLFVLNWVNRNIAKFGGDPTKVTLGGHSSGAMLAGYHLLTKKAKGLFRSIILQSGSPLTSVSHIRNPKHLAFALGEKLSTDFTSKNTSEDLLKLLRSVPVEKITETDIEYPEWFDYPASGYRPPFAPILEDPNYENSVVIGPMHDNFEKGIFNRVPILTGITSEEFIDSDDAATAALLVDTNLTAILDPTLKIKKENFLPMAKEIKDIYSKKKPFAENIPGFIKAMGDILYSMPVIKNAFLCSKYSNVYFYQFSYRTPYSGYKKLIKWKKPGVLGLAAHSDELSLLYYFGLKPDIAPTIEDLHMRKKIIKLWTNFVKYTNPTPKKDPMFQNIMWPTVKQTNFRFVDIDSKLSLKKNPRNFIDWQNRLEKYFDSPRYSY